MFPLHDPDRNWMTNLGLLLAAQRMSVYHSLFAVRQTGYRETSRLGVQSALQTATLIRWIKIYKSFRIKSGVVTQIDRTVIYHPFRRIWLFHLFGRLYTSLHQVDQSHVWRYCGWKKPFTSWLVSYPAIYRVSTILLVVQDFFLWSFKIAIENAPFISVVDLPIQDRPRG